MDRRSVRLLVVVAVVALVAGGVLCMFHGDDFHAGSGHFCLLALAAGAATLPFVSPRLGWSLTEPIARPFVMLDCLAPPPRG